MSQQNVYTYADVIEHLIQSSGGGAQDAEQRDIRTAAQNAYRDVTSEADWECYHKLHRIALEAPVTGGTVQYTNSTKALVLSDATLPSTDLNHWRIIINRDVCRFASSSSSTDAVLDSIINPTADVAAGTTCTIYKNTYALPTDFRNMDNPIPKNLWSSGCYLTPGEFARYERRVLLAGSPFRWTIENDTEQIGGFVVRTWGYPVSDESLDFLYRRWPRQIKRSGHESASRVGTVSTTAGSTTVTGSGTSFTSAMVGSYIRISGDSTNSPEGLGGLNPYQEQLRIKSVASTTSLTAETAAEYTASGVKYIVTDPLDIPYYMVSLMQACSEYHLSRVRSKDNADEKYALYMHCLRRALEMDVVAPLSGRIGRLYDTMGNRSPRERDMGV